MQKMHICSKLCHLLDTYAHFCTNYVTKPHVIGPIFYGEYNGTMYAPVTLWKYTKNVPICAIFQNCLKIFLEHESLQKNLSIL